MIIISRSKKTIQPKSRAYSSAFGEKLMYIANPDKTLEVGIDHNLVSQPHDLRSIEQEFIENYEQYHSKHKNRVVMFHEFISFSPKDREVLLQNRDILEDIARKWLEIRAPNALGYAQIHRNTQHAHIHCMISGNNIASQKQLHLSQKLFREKQWELEKYKREYYPFLLQKDFHKQCYMSKTKQLTPNQRELERRTHGMEIEEPSRKKQITRQIQMCLERSRSVQEFKDLLKTHDLEFYTRGKKTLGVRDYQDIMKNGELRKHRLKTLELDNVFQEKLKQWEKKLELEKESPEIELG